MKFDPKKIVSLIVTQRSAIVQLLNDHERDKVFTPRIMKLCRAGSEAGVVQLALMDDCLHAIESVLFSLNGSRTIDSAAIYRFLQPVARLYAKKDKSIYARFSELKQPDYESFLEAHYTDGGPFDGANRRTKWSGFQLAKNADRLRINGSGLMDYRCMFEAVVAPLLDEDENFSDVIELGGLWSAMQSGNENSNQIAHDSNASVAVETQSLAVADFGNPSVLFDVVPGPGCSPVVKLNSSHQAFQNGRSFELLLQAWAEMESNAWDRRKQLLGDIRSDWGRAARDLLAGSAESLSE
jgi:hypothetical protein